MRGAAPGGGFDPRTFNQDGIDISDLLGGIFGRGGRGGRARAAAAARPRPRGRRDDLVPRQPERRARLDRRSRRSRPAPTATAPARRPGTRADHLPGLRGPRRARAGPGLLLALAAVPALRRHRPRDRAPVPDLRRARLDAAPAPLPGADPGRHQGRRAHPPARQGRGGLARRARRRPLREGHRRALAGLHAPRRRPRRRRARELQRGRGGRRDRGARARRRARPAEAAAGTGDGVLLRARGRGAPKNGDSGKRGDLLARVHISVPRKLSRAQKEALEKFAALEGDDPRADLFARAAEA